MHTLTMLRENPDGEPVRLFASHADPDSPVLTAADTIVPEPDGVDDAYVNGALALCTEAKIDVFWPTWQAPTLAAHRARFSSAGAALLAGEHSGLALCTDKARVYAALAGTDVLIPRHHVARAAADLYRAFADLRASGPVCVKPLTGAGAAGFRILRDAPATAGSLFSSLRPDAHVDDIAAALSTPGAPPLLVMPVLPGPELSVDVLARDGVLLGGLIRCKRDGMRGVEITDDPGVLLIAADIVAALRLSMLANIQFRFDDRGRPALLEVNARASGGLYQTAGTGWNLAWAAVRLLLDGEVTLPAPRLPQRLVTVPAVVSVRMPALSVRPGPRRPRPVAIPEPAGQLRHFGYLTPRQDELLFEQVPQRFWPGSARGVLAIALGATLYTPGTCTDYARRMPALLRRGVVSFVLCLEDAIRDADVLTAERNVVDQLHALHSGTAAAPLLFVRVRHPDQVLLLVKELGEAAAVLTGFVFPKFTAAGPDFLGALAQARADTGLPLYGMPVLESAEVMYSETRVRELLAIRAQLTEQLDAVLAVRIGATDLCGLFGLRRGSDTTVYDVAVARAAIADIVNILRRDGRFVVAGPVWEYFNGSYERPLGSRLRAEPDGLLREVALDKATGLVGKTVIHPGHVRPVHAMLAATAEEFSDARAALGLPDGGVRSSEYGNKMLEGRPHARWAADIRHRAAVFGVLRPERTFADLLAAADEQP